jgi:hypothetical protein
MAHSVGGRGCPDVDLSNLCSLFPMRSRLHVKLCQGRIVVGDLACFLDSVSRARSLDGAVFASLRQNRTPPAEGSS